MIHALLIAAAIAPAALLPRRVPTGLALALFVAAHWLAAFEPRAHVVVGLAAVAFWSPLLHGLTGPAASAYVLAGMVGGDTAAVYLFATGNGSFGLELLVGMLPVALAFVVVSWRWLRAEELDARAA